MNRMTWLVRSLSYHRRIHVSVALGVAAATAVLTGSLLVGSSMRGSLRGLTLDRLGRIDEILTSRRFFDGTAALEQLDGARPHLAGLLWLPGTTAETTGDGAVRRSADVQLIGADERIADFWPEVARPKRAPEEGEVILNRELAEDLGIDPEQVAAGAEVLVTLRPPKLQAVSSDSPLGEKEDLTWSMPRLRVIEVIEDAGVGRFGPFPTQLAPRTAWVAIDRLRSVYDLPEGSINTLWAGDDAIESAPESDATERLGRQLAPSFADYGLLLERSTAPTVGDQAPLFDWWYVASDRMVIEPAMATELRAALQGTGATEILTYLANDLDRFGEDGEEPDGRSGVPFSMVSALDFDDAFRPLDVDGRPIPDLAEDEIVLNRWAADDLGARVGDRIRMTYYRPETTHGKTDEAHVDLKLVAIAALTEPAEAASRRRPARFLSPPTWANDPDLTPVVPGVTDQDSIENWDLPFPTADRIRKQDDEYWKFHRTTPKGFVAAALGRRLWGSRFGEATGFRVSARELTGEELERRIVERLHASDDRLGFAFTAAKRDGLRSASGTTPFDGLFLGLSLFVIVAALMLVILLYRLGLERRLEEIGTMLALGFSRRDVARLAAAEGMIVALMGSLLGSGIGIAYAALMVLGLQTWWVGAVRTPFLRLHVDPVALAIGFAASAIVCGLTIVLTVSRFRPGEVRGLLAGRIEESTGPTVGGSRRRLVVAAIALAAAAAGAIAGTSLGGEAQAGAFLGAGAGLLTALLALLGWWLRLPSGGERGWGLSRLAQRNGSRNPTRSTLTVGLVAAATFLIGGISAFRLAPTERGVGGFDLVAETSRPIFVDLNDAAERRSRFAAEAPTLESVGVLAFRWRRGDDASCNNPFRAAQPQVMGVSTDMASWFDEPTHPAFGWAGTESRDESVRANPWRALDPERATPAGEPIPVVIDKNTAMWGLQVYSVGQRFTIEYEEVGRVEFRAVAFLDNTILQGRLLIGDADFRRLFPDEEGDRFFLVRTGAADEAIRTRIRGLLEDRLGDVGFATRRSDRVLGELLAVQNTYLSTFQSLGALGLLLGTFGLATVQLRSVLERRGELALMQAIGFRRRRLMSLVALENAWLLLLGLGIGGASAIGVVLPHWWFGAASVPWRELGVILGAVALIGVLTGSLASRSLLGIDVKRSLRG